MIQLLSGFLSSLSGQSSLEPSHPVVGEAQGTWRGHVWVFQLQVKS